jgi:exopolysaccharide production protein ExoQ
MIANENAIQSSTRPRHLSGFSMAGAAGFYFGLRVCITFLFFQSNPQAGAIVSVGANLLVLLVVAIYAIGPAKESLRKAVGTPTIRLVLSFLALAVVSLAWSETPSKGVALGYWCALAADVFLVLLLACANGFAATSETLLKGYVWGVAILSVIAWCAPAMQDLRLGDDDFLTPNAIGFACAIGTLLCQYFAHEEESLKWLGGFLALTLLRSLSKTSIAAFIVAEALYLYRTPLVTRAAKMKVLAGALITAAIFSGLIWRYYNVYANAGNQAETLTGRTSIWIVAVGLALEEPWLGHGFHAFRSVIPAFGAFEPWHAHNELIQQFFTYGLAGVVLVVTLYGSFLRLCERCSSHRFSLTGQSLLVLVLIRGFADTERFDLSFPLWALTTASLLLRFEEVQA